jgi:hypothetical protein
MSVTNDQIRQMPRQRPTPLARKLAGEIDHKEYKRLMATQRAREERARISGRRNKQES